MNDGRERWIISHLTARVIRLALYKDDGDCIGILTMAVEQGRPALALMRMKAPAIRRDEFFTRIGSATIIAENIATVALQLADRMTLLAPSNEVGLACYIFADPATTLKDLAEMVKEFREAAPEKEGEEEVTTGEVLDLLDQAARDPDFLEVVAILKAAAARARGDVIGTC